MLHFGVEWANFDQKTCDIKDACGEGEYLFRGENRHYREISSKLYRQCYEWEELDNRDPLAILRMIPEYRIPGEEYSRDDDFPVLELEIRADMVAGAVWRFYEKNDSRWLDLIKSAFRTNEQGVIDGFGVARFAKQEWTGPIIR